MSWAVWVMFWVLTVLLPAIASPATSPVLSLLPPKVSLSPMTLSPSTRSPCQILSLLIDCSCWLVLWLLMGTVNEILIGCWSLVRRSRFRCPVSLLDSYEKALRSPISCPSGSLFVSIMMPSMRLRTVTCALFSWQWMVVHPLSM